MKLIGATCCYQLLSTYCFLYLLGSQQADRTEAPSHRNLELMRTVKQKKQFSTIAQERETTCIWWAVCGVRNWDGRSP